MRAPSDSDFTLTLEGVGDFVFAHRTIGDMFNIRVRFLLLLGENENLRNDGELSIFADLMSVYNELIVSCPTGWDDISKLNAEGTDNALILYKMLTEKEDSFRVKPKGTSKAKG
jgi:hypothetical protein